jgi:hypothetical protein
MKNEPTLEDWKEIGAKAKVVRNNLLDLMTLISGKLPKYQYLKKWDSADKAFDNLRSHLDDIVCNRFTDHPNDEIIHIFYGMDEKK